MNRKRSICVGITMGDPSGIGPEIILKSYQNRSLGNMKILVIGDFQVMEAAYGLLERKSFRLNRIRDVSEAEFMPGILNVMDLQVVSMNTLHPGQVQAISGHAAYECIRTAIELATKKEIDAVATAPINKEALHQAGHHFPGHTEIFAELTGTGDYAMLLHDKKLSVIHVSTHVSMLEAITGLRRERIEKVIALADGVMKGLLGREPRIAVAGLNPHAGEHGLFGDEELREIIPAVAHMREQGIDVEGPFPPDTIFLNTVHGHHDIVVAMYHDQGHIPLKLLGFSSGVNVTVGLPFPRTSVDHGTAFEIAWQGKADPQSMVEAIKLAIKLAPKDVYPPREASG